MSSLPRRIVALVAFTLCVAGDGRRNADAGSENQPAAKAYLHGNLVYAEASGQKLVLDLYLPAGVKKPPLVVYIHGGSWRAGSHKKPPVAWLVDEGFALASVSYRFSDKAIFPAQIHDCKAAIRWLRAQDGNHGYDASRIAVVGSSAGGHLAALLGTSGGVKELEGDLGNQPKQSSRVQAVVDFYGPADFLLRARTQPSSLKAGSSVHGLLGGPATEKAELARLASPVAHVTADDPPLLILHGDKDSTVLLDQSERLRDAYKEAKLEVTLHVVSGGGHGGAAFYSGENRKRVVDFLSKHLRMPKGVGPP